MNPLMTLILGWRSIVSILMFLSPVVFEELKREHVQIERFSLSLYIYTVDFVKVLTQWKKKCTK